MLLLRLKQLVQVEVLPLVSATGTVLDAAEPIPCYTTTTVSGVDADFNISKNWDCIYCVYY